MNREHKFRGRRKDIEWKYGYLTCIETRQLDGWEQKPAIRPFSELFISYGVDSESIGEFTGLKDAKGKEVFEGDIINHSLWGIAIVRFGKGANLGGGDSSSYFYGYYLEFNNKKDNYGNKEVSSGELLDPNEIEVIGNLYENPALIKEW